MEWTHGDLSLIKGISVNGDAKNKPGVPANRRVLKHMRYDKKTGHYVPSQHKKLNRMRVRVEVDRVSITTLREVLDHAYGKEKVQESAGNLGNCLFGGQRKAS